MHIPVTSSCPQGARTLSSTELGSLWLGASWEAAGTIVCHRWSSEVCSLFPSRFIVRGVGIAMRCLCVCWLDGKRKETGLEMWEWLSQRGGEGAGGGGWETG